jgi:hypothetical protein
MKLLSEPATRLAAGPAALLAALLAAELPAAGRGRYAPPPPPPPLLRMSGLFAALGAAEHLRARLAEAAEYVQPRAGGAGAARPAVRRGVRAGSRLRAPKSAALGVASRQAGLPEERGEAVTCARLMRLGAAWGVLAASHSHYFPPARVSTCSQMCTDAGRHRPPVYKSRRSGRRASAP